MLPIGSIPPTHQVLWVPCYRIDPVRHREVTLGREHRHVEAALEAPGQHRLEDMMLTSETDGWAARGLIAVDSQALSAATASLGNLELLSTTLDGAKYFVELLEPDRVPVTGRYAVVALYQ